MPARIVTAAKPNARSVAAINSLAVAPTNRV